MAQWVLKANDYVVPRSSLRPLTVAELHSPTKEKKRAVFAKLIIKKHGHPLKPHPNTHEDIE